MPRGRPKGAKDLTPRTRSPDKQPRVRRVDYPELIQVKLTPAQRAYVERRAERTGKNISAVIRALIDKSRPKPKAADEAPREA